MDSIVFYFNSRENLFAQIKRKRMDLRFKATKILELPDELFIKHFRLNKPAFKYVLRELKRQLPPVARSSSISPELKLAASLRFLAEGGYQHGVGQDFNLGMAQSTISVVLSEVLNILEVQLCPRWISLAMTEEEKSEARLHFYRKGRIPGVIMCIDGTHIKISKPTGENSHLFLNRKGFYSLNAMIVCDHEQKIRYVDAKYPGSSHDSVVWGNSEAYQYFKSLYDNGDRNTRLLGVGTPKSRFNTTHSKARNVIERTFGVWKNWCRCCLGARQLHYSPTKAIQIVNVAAALHNIRIHFKSNDQNVADFEEGDDAGEEEEREDVPEEINQNNIYQEQANVLRNEFLVNF
ncbi:putative nuclease HARBI1 [Episyrphus balteatus]|uniref:putative nuclease HARBI1 n=1 Tax=Episyrphus balteatus TaxID=286459 RepID=UPI0024850DBE|nr:putative nuclease HARBI1 [Episyrphus balteatus]